MTELTCHVIRVRREIEICSMTIPTRHGQVLILIVDVTTIAGSRLVSTCQRKSCCAVAERRWHPHRRCVAGTAVVTEVAEHMVGICWLRKLGLMALVAICEVQLVVAVHMACLT